MKKKEAEQNAVAPEEQKELTPEEQQAARKAKALKAVSYTHLAGDKWCIYPMYDFQHPIQDAIEGITHSLCSLEYEIHRPLYDWMVQQAGFEHPPRQIEFARLNIMFV